MDEATDMQKRLGQQQWAPPTRTKQVNPLAQLMGLMLLGVWSSVIILWGLSVINAKSAFFFALSAFFFGWFVLTAQRVWRSYHE